MPADTRQCPHGFETPHVLLQSCTCCHCVTVPSMWFSDGCLLQPLPTPFPPVGSRNRPLSALASLCQISQVTPIELNVARGMEQEAPPNNGDEAASLSGNLHSPLCILRQEGSKDIVGSKKLVRGPWRPVAVKWPALKMQTKEAAGREGKASWL